VTFDRVAGVGLVLTLGLLGLICWHDRHPTPPIPPAVAARIDSLATTAPVFDSTVTTLLAGAERRAAEDRRLARKERALRALADTLGHRADSLALHASEAVDSAATWRGAYEARTVEAVALRVVVDTLHARVDTLTARGDSLHAVATLALERLDLTSGVVVDLRAAIVTATSCRWGGPLSLPCPSRRQSFVAGGLAVAGLVLLGR